ncbi:MAG: 1-deoxy-D-xylulose-5-phosphate reductoisomerase [Clostridium sp.]|uniref:1-deoxy-D-xylulose-5-phosphate reductoisomerase n=1 Tax=Clostridium sp. TaxID=1506 RepID=UPI002906DC41|nr:1-deoxy-D-xylulose-5-phosphate reductoisomerase [Clostridium sp.]MDU5109664.1 1-deoxy-D-xylulose-5-phosphate reductoisomerase [Clostridium sp.]
MKNISILGATGSIGTQTLDVIRKSNGEINLIGISANSSVNKIIEIIKEFKPKYVAMMDEESAKSVEGFCIDNGINIGVYKGIEGLKAIEAGKDIALANKETLVVAGELVMKKAKEMGVDILPVDSEHSAIFQALNGYNEKDVKKIILTASGGPFRGKDIEFLKKVTVEDALKHPKWNMGQKISIDSATLMNKGLEVIEAHFLFNCPYDNIQVVVHPQSIIHSMVEYNDASVIAQLGTTDMKLPIQYAINKKVRKDAVCDSLNFYELGSLTFEKPDLDTFKCLKLAYKVGKEGMLAPCVLNAANEEAVALLLEKKIKFLDIAELIEEALEVFKEEKTKEVTIENVITLDSEVRKYIRQKLN